MDILVILASIAAAAVAVAGTAVLASARARRERERVLLPVARRLEVAVRELDTLLERLGEQSRFGRAMTLLATSAGASDLLERLAAAAVEVTQARGAVARTTGPYDGDAVGSAGELPLSPSAIGGEWQLAGIRAVTFAALDGPEGAGGGQATGIAVPVAEESLGPVGVVIVFFDGHASASEQALGEVERLAAGAAPLLAAMLSGRRPPAEERRDPLTGLPARTPFYECLVREVDRAARQGTALALVVFDVDDLAAANRRMGQEAADALLRTIAASVEAAAPPGGVACRIGGDEFALVLPGAARLDAETAVARFGARHREGAAGAAGVTVSAGLAEVRPGDDPIALLDRAVSELATAKRAATTRWHGPR